MVTFWPRINTLLLLVIILMAGAIITMLASRAYGGPLDPPGAPVSTDGVREPGTPISSIPFAITQPGRYYLTRNLTGPGNSSYGIAIQANNVTLDLNGFTLDGGDKTGTAIIATSAADVSVENGVVTGYGSGINLSSAAFGHISHVQVHSLSTTIGNGIVPPNYGYLENCLVSDVNTGVRLTVGNVMRDCVVTLTASDGVEVAGESVVIKDNYIAAAGLGSGYGVRVTGQFSGGAVIRNNEFSDNGLRDIRIGTGIAMVFDNIVYCPDAVTQTSPNLMNAPMGSEPHANMPRVAAGFCS